MSKKLLFTIVLVVLGVTDITAQWVKGQKTYGGTNVDWVYSLEQTNDDGYIMAGKTRSFGAGDYDVYLIKTDFKGDTLWSKTYGESGVDESWSVQQTVDGGYVVAGYTNSFGSGDYDVYLIKTDSLGDTLWTKTYGGVGLDKAYSVKQATDGGYIIAGETESFGQGANDVYLIKTNSTGDTLWTKTYGGANNDYARSVTLTNDGGYILAGYTNSFGALYGVNLIKTDSAGNLLWSKTYEGTPTAWNREVKQTSDGGYIVVSSVSAFGAGSNDVYLIKTDSVGDTLWTRAYGETNQDDGGDVIQTDDGGYLVSGTMISTGTGGGVYLIKTDANGDTLWTQTYGNSSGSGSRNLGGLVQTSDGGYVVAGYTNSFGGFWYVYLIKTDSVGNSDCYQWNTQTIVTGSNATNVGTAVATITGSSGVGVEVNSTATVVTTPAAIVATLCEVLDSLTVNFAASDTILCEGNCINFYDSTQYPDTAYLSSCSWLWNFPGATPDTSTDRNPVNICYDTIGNYDVTLTITNTFGTYDTTFTNYIAVNNSAAPTASLTSTDVLCIGDSSGTATVTPSGGIPPYTYLWNDPASQTDSTAIGLSSGIYTVTVSDSSGCSLVDSVTVSEPAPFSVSITGTTYIACIGDSSGSATVTPAGGALPYTYLWDSNASSQTDSTATGLPAGTFTVTVTDANGCTDTAAVTINNPVGTSIAVDSIKNVTCNGDGDGAIYISITGGATPYTYLWTSTDTIEDVINLSGGSYGVTITDSAGCQSILDTSISEPTAISISIATVNVACNGDSTGSATVTPSGGTIPYSYTWNDPTLQTNAAAVSLSAGTYNVLVTDGNGCTDTAGAFISEPAALNLSLSSNPANCGSNDGQATVNVSGGTSPYAYSWNDPANQTNTTAINLQAGSYTATITDSNNCQDTASVTVTDLPLTAAAGPDTVVCIGESVQLNASGGSGYSWTPSAGLSDSAIQNPVASPSATTTYMVVVTLGSCVPDTAYVTVTVNPLPSVFAGYDTTIMLGNIVQLSGSGGIAYNWTPSTWLSCTACQSPIAIPEETITYIMTATDANSCSNIDSITIEVDNEFIIFVPDIFSPNANDFDNRAFTIRGKGIRKVISLVIYDRWGEKVFENKDFNANDPSQSWDGSYRGQLMNPGVFVYILEVVFENDEEKILKGDVTLVH